MKSDRPRASGSAAEAHRRRFAERFAAELPSLLRLAAGLLRHDDARGQYAPGDLVDEAFVKLVRSRALPRWEGRAPFLKLVGRVMRQVLSNEGRRARREARRRQRSRALLGRSGALVEAIYAHVDLDAAFDELRASRPEVVRLMMLCLRRGVTPTEAGKSLGIPGRRAREMWRLGVAFLARRLEPD